MEQKETKLDKRKPSVPQRVMEFQRVVDFSRGKPPASLSTGEEIFFNSGCSKIENPL